jgi:cytochrome c-type biogenesis protein CcmE
MRILGPVVVFVAGLVTLVTMGVVQGGIPELQVHEVLAGAFPDRQVKMHAIIHKIHSAEPPLRFTVEDRDATKKDVQVDVLCDRTRPDTFQETYDVAVLGTFDHTAKVFHAEQIFTKCPSKYEGEEKMGLNARSPAPVVPSNPEPPAGEPEKK